MATLTAENGKVRAVIIDGPETGHIISLPIDDAANAVAARELAAAEEALSVLSDYLHSPRKEESLERFAEQITEIKKKHGLP